MPRYLYPKDTDLKRQAVEVPGSKKPGQSAIYRNNIFDWESIYAENGKTCYELFELAVQRNGNATLYLTRPLLSAGNPTTTPPTPAIYSPTLKSISYNEANERRHVLGKALAVLEEDGRLAPKNKSAPPPSASDAGETKSQLHHGMSSGPSGIAQSRPEYIGNATFGVGIWSANRPEWQLVDLACQAFSMVSVALYDTLGPDVVEYVINHAPLSVVFATRNHVPTLLKLAGERKVECLRVVVVIDVVDDGQAQPVDAGQGTHEEKQVLKAWGRAVGIEVLSFGDMETLGRTEGLKRHIQARLPRPETLATISYTSGTTGMPKGVLLSHGTFTSAVVQQTTGHTQDIAPGDTRLLSYLPLAHIYERFLELVIPAVDGQIAYTTGDPLRLLEDAQIMKPTMFASVPRVLNRVHQAIMAQVYAGGMKGALLQRAINTKVENFKKTGQYTHAVYDALVFRKIKALLGGRVNYIGAGSAPLAGEVNDVLRACFCCDVVQGFGMTETVGTTSKSIGFDPNSSGTCGVPLPGIEIKVVDVAEMGYTSNDLPNPRGELLIRGPNIFSGYHKDEKNTRATLEPDGFMHTGDIAEIDSSGRIVIIDRLKNVMKLSQGEYVALEKIEGVYALCPLFSSLLVHGDSLHSHVVAIGVVDPVQGAAMVNKVLGKSLQPTDLDQLRTDVKDEKVKAEAVRQLTTYAKHAKLNGFEMVKQVHLMVDPFDPDLITPTMKLKRNLVAKAYKDVIEDMYNSYVTPAKL